MAVLGFASVVGGSGAGAWAQQSLPNPGETYKDTSMLKPPPGVRIAVIEFQDLTCPACAYAFPIVHQAVAHYNIPLLEHDFLLGGEHAEHGDLEAAIWARYLQDKVSPKIADDYRGAAFAGQNMIETKDDMQAFTRKFFQSHGLQMPFVADPTGELKKEVEADVALGTKLGVRFTPSIIVVTQHEWIHVTKVDSLYEAIDQLEAKLGPAASPVKTTAKKKPAQ
ncbi:MAG TPA: thioredoxin domain-containing protein [Acidobacteriaceae bacterium]|nr:thioredoxin domain-containing protein [Acidobacteriaceae bacterium]